MRRASLGLGLATWSLIVLAGAACAAEPDGTAADPVLRTAASAPDALSPAEIARVRELIDGPRLERDEGPTATIYGFVKLDLAYDAQATNEGNFARWVESEDVREDDDQFSITPRETRVGLKLHGPTFCAAEVSGLIELDFYGGGGENSSQLRMRHAYVKLVWPDCRITLLAGQTWDVVHPQNPPTINYSVGWWAGNVGFRRPQLRLSKGFGLGACTTGLLEAAVVRTITNRDTPFTPTFEDTGEDAGFPTVQGRISVSHEVTKGRTFILGVSGHWGHEELDQNAAGDKRDLETWSLGADVVIPLGQKTTLKGEVWIGRNMDAYLGGIGQGVNDAVAGAEREIDAQGGWISLQHKATSCVTLAVGGGIDDPDDDDLAAGNRSYNTHGFVNGWFRPTKRLGFGLELSYWLTEYVGLSDGDSIRVQFAIKYDF
ncbi:MAG: hypothetical protein QNJ90_10110 [Planctomycetota bacterium]|nr:hypothetical protein [Planctomycetota bacterium]